MALGVKMRRTVLASLFLFGLFSSLRAETPTDPALLLCLPFNEGTGTFTADRSPNALEADLSNVQWATGTFGTAVRFGGTNAFIEIPPVPGFTGATQFTLSVWAAWDGPATRYPNLLTTHTWCPGGLMLFVSDSACSFRMGRPGSTWSEVGANLLGTLPQRQWTHLCVTFSLPHITTYVNGKSAGHATWPYPVAADALRLGGWTGPVCHNGLLDDLRIFGRALCESEITSLAQDPSRANAAYALVDESKREQPLAASL